MKKLLGLAVGVATLTLSQALAGTASVTVPINGTAVSSCVFSTDNQNKTIDMLPLYQAGNTYTTDSGSVAVSVFCNNGTPLTERRLTDPSNPADFTTTAGTYTTNNIEVVLTRTSAPFDTLDVKTWFVAGSTQPNFVGSGALAIFNGATRYSTTIYAGYINNQFDVSSGFYSGPVTFTVTF